MSLVLAIDQSTSGTKAVLFDASGAVLDKSAREHRQLYPRAGWVEHDAEEIWLNTCAVVRELAQRRDLENLAGLAITNQRETVVAFDRQYGRPLHNAIVWQCQRGSSLCATLRERGANELVRTRTGLQLDAYFSGSKMAWLIENEPRIAARLRAGVAGLGTIDTYLVHRLTRGTVFATDQTNASRTLLFDVRKLCWDRDLCDLFSVPIDALPEVQESATTFGTTDVGGALPRPVPIVAVAGDSQAAFFAQRCFELGATKATFGSGTSVLMNIGSAFRLDDGGATALAWVYDGRPTYASEGLITFSAATIGWLRAQLGLIRDDTEVESLALSVPDCGGVYLVPAFAGLSSPHWSPHARAAILGMSAFTERAHVVRAGIESIAFQLRDVLETMRSGVGPGAREIFVDGGPTRNRFLMQFAADIVGATLSVSRIAEASAWGAAMHGFLNLGVFSSLEALSTLRRGVVQYHPGMPADDVQRLVEGWHAAVRRVL